VVLRPQQARVVDAVRELPLEPADVLWEDGLVM
jgi:hypothetical protein